MSHCHAVADRVARTNWKYRRPEMFAICGHIMSCTRLWRATIVDGPLLGYQTRQSCHGWSPIQ